MQQINANVVQQPDQKLSNVQSFGFIVWWSLHQKVYSLLELRQKGGSLPDSIAKSLIGEKPDGAFRKAVSLRKKQWKVEEDKDLVSYYVTDRAGDGYTLARETLNGKGVEIGLEQVGSVFLEGYDVKFTPTLYYSRYRDEVDKLIAHFQSELQKRTGQVDDTRLRTLLLGWLETNHRVALRPTGGVYMIPLTSKNAQRDRIYSELVTVREWIASCGMGELSSMEVFPTIGTTKQSIVTAAIDELNQELSTIEDRLHSYEKSVNMNAGSRMYSAGTQVDAVQAIREKISVLKDAGLMELQIDLAERLLRNVASKNSSTLADRVAEMYNLVSKDSTVVLSERDKIAELYKDLKKEETTAKADLGSNAFDALLLFSRVDLVLHRAETMHRESEKEVALERSSKAIFEPVKTTGMVRTSKTKVADSGTSGTARSRKKVTF